MDVQFTTEPWLDQNGAVIDLTGYTANLEMKTQPTDKALSDAAQQAQARARAAAGYTSTIASSPQGVLAPAVTSFKTLLGQ